MAEEAVFLAPEEQGGHAADAGGGGRPRLGAQGRAVPVDHRAHGAGLRPGLAVDGEVGIGEGAGAAGGPQGLHGEGEAVPAEGALGEPRELEEEDVGALLALLGALPQGAPHHPGMGDVEQDQPLEPVRVLDAQPPADDSPPVVPPHAGFLLSQSVDQAHGIERQPVQVVVGDPPRLAAQVVAPLVGGQHVEAGGGERPDLVPPAIPELGKAMEQDEQRPAFRSGFHGVQADAVGLDRPVPGLQLGVHGSVLGFSPRLQSRGVVRSDRRRTRSQAGSTSEMAPSKARPTPAAPSRKPASLRQPGSLVTGFTSQARKPATPSPGSWNPRVRSNQNRAASPNRSSPVSWYMRLKRWPRPAAPWQRPASRIIALGSGRAAAASPTSSASRSQAGSPMARAAASRAAAMPGSP